MKLGGFVRRSLVAATAALALGAGQARATLVDGSFGQATTAYPILATSLVPPAFLPPDPSVVTDEQLATVGATTPASMPVSNDPNRLVVDDDRAQCPSAQFTTAAGIQLAVDAAAPGQTIKVCPGTYSGVTINKANLTIQAPRGQGQANGCPGSPPDPTQDAIVQDQSPSGIVQIVSPGVSFDGFTIQNNSLGPGVRTDASASGYELGFNVIQANRIGVDLNTNGATATDIQHSCFRSNRDSAGGGRHIGSSAGYSNVVIEQNTFTGGFPGESIDNCSPTTFNVCIFSPVSNVAIIHNNLVDDGGLAFVGGSNIVVSYNTFLRCWGAAVATNNVVNLDVSFNLLDGDGVPITQGIAVSGDQGVVLNTSIKSNIARDLVGGFLTPTLEFFGLGIVIRGSGVEVKTNQIEFNKGSGVFLGSQAKNDTVRGNLIVGNGLPGIAFDTLPRPSSDGIKILSGAVANTIDNNRLGAPLSSQESPSRANIDHDCHDNNPLGANTWTNNVGYTENQPGLCVHTS